MANLPVNIADLIFAGIVLVSGVLALYRGFVTEVLAIVGWAGAAIATVALFQPLRPYARDYIPSKIGADLATGIVIFLVALLVISLLARVVANTVRGNRIGVVDRVLGLLFGLLRGYAVVVLLFFVFEEKLEADGPDWAYPASAGPLIEFGTDVFRRFVPQPLPTDNPLFNRASLSSTTFARPQGRDDESGGKPIPSLTSPRPPAITAPTP